MITQEQFLELSAKLYIAQQHSQEFFKFEDNLISQETAWLVLEEYRKTNLPITYYGKIPDSISQNFKL
jgi:hypothetical protein